MSSPVLVREKKKLNKGVKGFRRWRYLLLLINSNHSYFHVFRSIEYCLFLVKLTEKPLNKFATINLIKMKKPAQTMTL